jgi:sugar O-acyltransferase (sialic acid O-acetyltransferase NeuD family)
MKKYFVEKFNASDDSFKITELFIKSGDFVTCGELIMSIESSKADIDVEAQESGYLYFKISKGDIINVGDLFYLISKDSLDNCNQYFEIKSIEKKEGFTISNKANALLVKFDLSPEVLNKRIIKESDVIEFVEKKENKGSVFDKSLLIPYGSDKIPIIIIGAGGGAKMCIDSLRDSKEYVIVGLLDDNIDFGSKVLEVPVVGNLNAVDSLLELSINNFIIAFGVLEKRKKRFELFLKLKDKGCLFPNIIHPKAIVEKSVKMGSGNIILAGANVGSSVILGDLNYINNNSLISHDCCFMNNIHIAPSAVLASSIKIESHVLVGMNSTIFYGLKIGESTTILNGLIINSNIHNDVIQKVNN